MTQKEAVKRLTALADGKYATLDKSVVLNAPGQRGPVKKFNIYVAKIGHFNYGSWEKCLEFLRKEMTHENDMSEI